MASAKGRHFQIALDSIERFSQETTLDGLNTAVAASTALFGYRYFCFASAPTPQRRQINQRQLLIAWPQAWLKQYDHQKLVDHDKIAAALRTSPTSFRWSDVAVDDAASRRVMQIAASDFAMKKGFGVPLFGLNGYEGGLTLAGPDIDDTDEANAAVELLSVFAFSHLTRLRSVMKTAKPKLTKREREVMHWVAAGKTAWDIGVILVISADTVNKTIASAMRRLEACTRAQAVAEAIRHREIEL